MREIDRIGVLLVAAALGAAACMFGPILVVAVKVVIWAWGGALEWQPR